jgi:hypothetical protein
MQSLQPIKYDISQALANELTLKQVKIIAQYQENKDIEVIKKAAREAAKPRIQVEKRRKEYKAEALEFGREVDRTAKEAIAPFVAIEAAYNDIIIDYHAELERLALEAKKKEEARIAKIQDRIVRIKEFAEDAYMLNKSEFISKTVLDFNGFVNNGFDYQEFTQEAEKTINDVQLKLSEIYNNKKAQEAEQFALEEQRKKDEVERAKFEAEKAEFEKLKRESEAKFKAERDLIDLQKREEDKRKHEAEMQKERDELEALRERDRLKRIEAEKQEVARLAEIEKEFEQKRIAQEKDDKLRNAAPYLLKSLEEIINDYERHIVLDAAINNAKIVIKLAKEG